MAEEQILPDAFAVTILRLRDQLAQVTQERNTAWDAYAGARDTAVAMEEERDNAIKEAEHAEAQLARVTAERDALDLKWAAASDFIRDVLFALGQSEPPYEAIVDLPTIALNVVGQIEEYKVRAEHAEAQCAALREERDAARMGLFWHLTGEHALAQPIYAQLAEQYAAIRAALRDLIDAIPESTVADDQPLGTWIQLAEHALLTTPPVATDRKE